MDTGWHPPFFSFRQMFGPRALFKGLPRIGPGANGIQTKPTKSPKWDKSFTFQYLSTPPSGIISNLKHRVQSVNDVCTLKILAYHESWRIWRGNCTRLDPTSHGPSNNYLLNLLSPTLPFHPKERLFGIFLPSPSVIHNCRLLSKRSCWFWICKVSCPSKPWKTGLKGPRKRYQQCFLNGGLPDYMGKSHEII